jgi:hypothetical protein
MGIKGMVLEGVYSFHLLHGTDYESSFVFSGFITLVNFLTN